MFEPDDRSWLEPPADSEPVFYCSVCDRPFYEGDPYYEIDDEKLCIDCVMDSYKKFA